MTDTTIDATQPNQSTEKSQIKKKTPGIIVIADLGGSLSKVIYQNYPSGEPQVFSIDSQIVDVDINILKKQQFSVGGGNPEDNCWVSLPSEGGFAMGTLATNSFGANAMLKSRKFDLACPKIAGILWIVSQKLNKKLKTSSLGVTLHVLLPPSEGGKGSTLKEKLDTELSNFETPTGQLSIELLDFKVVPEGYGISRYYSMLHDEEFKKQNISVVQIGYRNLSILPFVRGKMESGISTDKGMYWLIDKFVKDSGAGLDASKFDVVETLIKSGDDCDATILSKLSRKRNIEERVADGEELASVAQTSRSAYVVAVTSWLEENIPDKTDLIIFCGGTARYIKKELIEYCKNQEIAIEWDGGITIPSALDNINLGERLADAYGLYYHYIGYLSQKKKAKRPG